MILGLTGLVCLSMGEFVGLQGRYKEVPVWSYTLPNKTIVQVWENKETGTSTIVYLNRIGRVCVLDIDTKKKMEPRDGETF